MIRLFKNRLVLSAVPAILVMVVVKPAMAFWLGFFSGAATVGAAAVTDGLAIAAGVAQVGGLGTHCATGGDDFKPNFVNSATAAPFPVCTNTMLSTTYSTYGLPGNALDPLYAAVNTMIGALNAIDADANAHASSATLLNDAHTIGGDTIAISSQASALLAAVSLTSTDFNTAAAGIGTSGLPPGEVSFLSAAGWTASDLSRLQAFDASLTINLNVPSISVQGIIQTLGEEEYSVKSIPEPASTINYILTGIAGLGIALLLSAKRFRF